MKAILKKIELKKMMNRDYLKITMESQKKEYIVSNPLMSNPINFRKQVFGILSACDCYDLMKLARKVSVPQKAIGYYFEGGGYKILENRDEEWLLFNEKTETYSCQKADKHTKKLIKMTQEHNISNVTMDEGSIESVVSRSGVFNIWFQSKNTGSSCMTTRQVYWGFGKPINIGNNASDKEKLKSAEMFTSFIVSLMKFFNKDDLLKLGGDIEKYPEVEITFNHSNKVNSIRNPITGLGFRIGKNYEIIDHTEICNANKNWQDEDKSF